MTSNAVLAFGNFRKSARIDLSVLAQEAALELKFADKPNEVSDWLDENTPRVLLIDDTSEDAAQMCQIARSRVERAGLPIISVAKELDDLSFEEVFSWGGDDAVELSSVRPLLARVRALPTDSDKTVPSVRGMAVVADPDRARRLVRARVLRNAGYSVNFAVTAEDAANFVASQNAALVVIDSDLPDAASLLKKSQHEIENGQTIFILLCPPRHIAELSAEVGGGTNRVAVSDGFAPPENVLFIANELRRGGTSDKRASRRMLYGTKVSFRGEGRPVDDYGFTYNVSAGGMYVRTLAPPVDDVVWLELQPPRADRRVRLECEVVWRRPFGPADHATVPPGFGARISDATKRNMECWLNGYNAFLAGLGLADPVSKAS